VRRTAHYQETFDQQALCQDKKSLFSSGLAFFRRK
jgi:hypothetical protein